MPQWLGMLTTHEIAFFLGDPRGNFGKHLADRLDGSASITRADSSASLDIGNHRWMLRPNEVEALEELRERLDAWWTELPIDAQDAIRAHKAGTVPGFYRHAVEDLGPEGAILSRGNPLQYPVQLPKLIVGYVKLIND